MVIQSWRNKLRNTGRDRKEGVQTLPPLHTKLILHVLLVRVKCIQYINSLGLLDRNKPAANLSHIICTSEHLHDSKPHTLKDVKKIHTDRN